MHAFKGVNSRAKVLSGRSAHFCLGWLMSEVLTLPTTLAKVSQGLAFHMVTMTTVAVSGWRG